MPEPYQAQRTWNQNISGSLLVAAGTTTTTVVTNARPLTDTIFVQKLHVEVTAGAAQTWSLQDSTGALIVPALSSAAIAHFDFDFGPYGAPCTLGANLTVTISGAGAVGIVTWEGYQKRTVVGAA